jgi:hypothetical protein
MPVRVGDKMQPNTVLVAHACGGHVMVGQVPHSLEGEYVQSFLDEQEATTSAYLESLGLKAAQLMTPEQKAVLEKKLAEGRYVCHHDASWLKVVRDPKAANHRWNSFISVAPTGWARLIDAMAAAKRNVLAAGGRCVAAHTVLGVSRV